MTKVGVAGLGRMGAAIALRLIDRGFEVHVWNRDPKRVIPLVDKGAEPAENPAMLVGAVDVILTILTDAAAIDAVYRGSDGVLAGSLSGKIVLEMSTVRPATEEALAREVAAKGGAFVECPVGGTVGPARNGQLIGFVGGEGQVIERAKPLLEAMCKRFDHVGAVGAGSSFKLAINLPLAVFWEAFGEAYALVKHLPIDRAKMIEIMAETSGAPNVLRARGATVAEALGGKDLGPGMFDCDGMRKDLRTMIDEGKARGVATLPVAAAALKVFDEASAAGWGTKDCMQMPTYLSRDA